jgi:acetate kinase
MPIVLALNPGSNSLKFDIVDVHKGQRFAAEGEKLATGAIDNIGKDATAELIRDGEKLVDRKAPSNDFTEATKGIYDLLADPAAGKTDPLPKIDLVAIRVVHGGDSFKQAVALDDKVRKEIKQREKLAPLHNKNSLLIADAVQEHASDTPVSVAFDTAFHHTIPEHAWRYPLPRELADKHNIRKFGFHGLSHRYLLERYAQLAQRPLQEISAVTLHLESGSSACAIQNGQSIDTSMGFTPLEGLMMGTRSGSIDPAILPFLMDAENLNVSEAMHILEKESGLLGVSGITLDTRILRKKEDPHAKQAIQIFAYRALQFVGAYLAVLGKAEAVVFGGGIGENTPEVRNTIMDGLAGWGFQVDSEANAKTVGGEAHISLPGSPLAAWVIHSEEGLQLAHECAMLQG